MNGINLTKKTDTKNNFDIFVIDAGTIEGVNIPCLLALPENLKDKNKLTLIFNNQTGDTLEEQLSSIEDGIPSILDTLQFDSPIVLPILPPRAEFNKSLIEQGINFEVGESMQFAAECFYSEVPSDNKFYRLDNQVSTLIENIISNNDIKEAIQAQRSNNSGSLEFEDKLIGFGHSGAGAAMLRFSMLKPELLDTLIIGGNGDIIPTPFGKNGDILDYPFGKGDYNQLFGREFPEDAYKQIQFQFYIGDLEDTKEVYDTIRDGNYQEGKTGSNFAPEHLATLYKQLYGKGFFERFSNALNEFEQNGYNIGLKIYENNCHGLITTQDFHSIIDDNIYFDSNCYSQIQDSIFQKSDSVFSAREMLSLISSIDDRDDANKQVNNDTRLLINQRDSNDPSLED